MGIANKQNKNIETQNQLASLVEKHTKSEGLQHTMIPTLQLLRASNVSEPLHSIYEPSIIVIAQGSKIVTLGNESYQYNETSYLVASVHLPIVGQIIEATPEKPYLCAQIAFTTEQILDVMKEIDYVGSRKTDSVRGIVVNKTNPALLDAVLRFVKLLDTPKDIQFLSPLIIREILYRILQDDHGNLIKQFAMNGSYSHVMGRILNLIHDDYSKPLRIEELAETANMSTSSLHSHFKRVTAMTPLQYQKMIRLQEARRLLLNDSSMDAANVGFLVGYESPSQFSREYARMFGLPPISDVKKT